MKIVIDIPKEFEKDLKQKGMFGAENMFVEFFNRVKSGIKIHSNLCGRYEFETAGMFAKAFANVQTDSELLDKVAEIFPKSFCTYCNQEACDGGMVGTIQECETIRMIKDVIDGIIEDMKAEV